MDRFEKGTGVLGDDMKLFLFDGFLIHKLTTYSEG